MCFYYYHFFGEIKMYIFVSRFINLLIQRTTCSRITQINTSLKDQGHRFHAPHVAAVVPLMLVVQVR